MNLLRRFLGIVSRIPQVIIWIIAYPLAIFAIVIIKIWDHFTRKHFAPIPRTPIHRTVSAPQVPSGPVMLPDGYQVRRLPDGGAEVIPLPLWDEVLSLGLLRHSWVAGPGWIARRTRVLGRFWDRLYSNLSGFEIHHGIWDTRKGCTDTLWLRTAVWPRMIRVVEHEDSQWIGQRAKALHELTVHPDVAALGRFLSNKSGALLSEITEEIPEPDHGGA